MNQQTPDTPPPRSDIRPYYEPDSGTWTYLLGDPEQKQAAIIDPVWVYNPVTGRCDAGFIEKVLNQANELGYQVNWVLETHAHADHLSAADFIRRKTGAKVAIGRDICSVQENFARVFNLPELKTNGSQFDRLLSDGEVIQAGSLDIRVMATPGHTRDSVSYLVEDAVFVGDTLFRPSYGTARCDFPGGDAGQLFDSIQKIYSLPDSTRLFLCHDYPEKEGAPVAMIPLEESRSENCHLKSDTTKEAFVELRTARDRTLSMPRLLLPSLQVNIRAGAPPAAENNEVSYLKMPFNTSIADLLN